MGMTDREMARRNAERGLEFIEQARAGERLNDAQCDVITFVLGLAVGQGERIEQLQARVLELESALQLLSGVRVS